MAGDAAVYTAIGCLVTLRLCYRRLRSKVKQLQEAMDDGLGGCFRGHLVKTADENWVWLRIRLEFKYIPQGSHVYFEDLKVSINGQIPLIL